MFSGWMFASSPALSALEHPVYDVNLLDCKGGDAASPRHRLARQPATRGKDAR